MQQPNNCTTGIEITLQTIDQLKNDITNTKLLLNDVTKKLKEGKDHSNDMESVRIQLIGENKELQKEIDRMKLRYEEEINVWLKKIKDLDTTESRLNTVETFPVKPRWRVAPIYRTHKYNKEQSQNYISNRKS